MTAPQPRAGHHAAVQPARTDPGPRPPGPAVAGSPVPAWPAGPCLVYVHGPTPGGDPPRVTVIDETAVDGARDRVVCRALLDHARQLLDDAERSDPPRTGNYL